MPNKTIDDFSAVVTPATTDTVLVTQSGVAKKETLAQIDTLLSATTKTLTNKTLTAPVINVGSDANGDIYYRAAGLFARLAKGTGYQVLRMNSGATAPEWAALARRVNKTEADSPYTVVSTELTGLVTYTNTGASDETVFNLPAGVDGYKFVGVVTAAQYMKFVANGTEKIRYLATQTAAGGYIRSNVIGNVVEGVWSGTEWVITGMGGAWTYDS